MNKKIDPRKLQIAFDTEAMKVIEELKRATGGTAADVIRDALGFYEWARRQRLEGRSIGTIKNGRAEAEVILPFELRGTLAGKMGH